MGPLLELLRRVGSATADAAAGFLFSEDASPEREEQEEEQQQQSLLDTPADSAEIKEEHARESALDTLCEDLTESMDSLGASHDHQGDDGLSMTPEIASQAAGMHHSR